MRTHHRPPARLSAMLLAVLCHMLGGLLGTSSALAEPGIFLIGAYEVVTARRASDVAGTPGDAYADAAVGRTVVFGDTLLWVDGSECSDWTSAEAESGDVVHVDDPLLSDLRLASRGRRGSFGQQDERLGFMLACGGRAIGAVQIMDARVLVVPTPSGQSNLILERPTGADTVRKLQRALAGRGLYEGEETGVLDAATRRGLALRAHELGAEYAFAVGIVTVDILLDLVGE